MTNLYISGVIKTKMINRMMKLLYLVYEFETKKKIN